MISLSLTLLDNYELLAQLLRCVLSDLAQLARVHHEHALGRIWRRPRDEREACGVLSAAVEPLDGNRVVALGEEVAVDGLARAAGSRPSAAAR